MCVAEIPGRILTLRFAASSVPALGFPVVYTAAHHCLCPVRPLHRFVQFLLLHAGKCTARHCGLSLSHNSLLSRFGHFFGLLVHLCYECCHAESLPFQCPPNLCSSLWAVVFQEVGFLVSCGRLVLCVFTDGGDCASGGQLPVPSLSTAH